MLKDFVGFESEFRKAFRSKINGEVSSIYQSVTSYCLFKWMKMSSPVEGLVVKLFITRRHAFFDNKKLKKSSNQASSLSMNSLSIRFMTTTSSTIGTQHPNQPMTISAKPIF